MTVTSTGPTSATVNVPAGPGSLSVGLHTLSIRALDAAGNWGNPATVTVNVTYLVGSRMENYGETGMAHLLEHLMFKGSTRFPDPDREFSARGFHNNGSTSYDRTNYFSTFQATDDNLKWALDLESDRMVNSFIRKADLDSEFTVVRNEFEASENNPIGVLLQRAWSSAYRPTCKCCS